MRLWQTLVMASILGGASLQACEPLSDHEREMRRLDKELAKAQKQLERAKRLNPDAFIKYGRQERSSIRMFIQNHEFDRAKATLYRLNELNVDNGDFYEDIESEVKGILERLPESRLLKRYDGYSFLTTLRPDNATYSEQMDAIKAGVIERATQARKQLRAEHDKVEGITWYHPRNTTTDPTVACPPKSGSF